MVDGDSNVFYTHKHTVTGDTTPVWGGQEAQQQRAQTPDQDKVYEITLFSVCCDSIFAVNVRLKSV